MITTTLAVFALAGGIGSGVIPSTPNLQTDYAQAMNRASEERKPIAVFIGHGDASFQKMLVEGKIPTDAAKLLRDSYVCLYLDADTASGKDLAGRFEISEGLVISGPGGSLQAYRHNGTVTGAELTKQLTQYASAGQPASTVNAGVSTGVRYVVGGCANGSCGTTYTYVPSSGQYVIPAGGYSSCPTGTCPNRR
jgi:hypothetical protein